MPMPTVRTPVLDTSSAANPSTCRPTTADPIAATDRRSVSLSDANEAVLRLTFLTPEQAPAPSQGRTASPGSHLDGCGRRSGSVVCLAAEEGEQGGVDLVGVSPADVVWSVRDLDHAQIGDQTLAPQPGGCESQREDPIGRTVNGQDRDVDLGQVVAEVGQPRVDARVGSVWPATGGHLEARVQSLRADPLRHGHVRVVEVADERLEEVVAVGDDRLL